MARIISAVYSSAMDAARNLTQWFRLSQSASSSASHRLALCLNFADVEATNLRCAYVRH